MLNDQDKKIISQHVRSWQVFTRDMVTALQVEQWIFSKADLEIENHELNENGAPTDDTKDDHDAQMRNYGSMEKLVVLWNQYYLKHARNSFSRGEVKRWLDEVVK